MGIPIVAHDGTSIPEVTQGSALLVDARDPGALANALEQITKPEVAQQFSYHGDGFEAANAADRGFDKLQNLLLQTANGTARLQQKGVSSVDGLIGHFSAFALPRNMAEAKLTIATQPLFEDRTLIVHCGPQMQKSLKIRGDTPEEFTIPIETSHPTLVLEVTDAHRMNDHDPRKHGLLLRELRLNCAGLDWNLLHPQP